MTDRILSRRDVTLAEPTAQNRLPRIGIMGEFSAGKTTFLNFLLGEALLPTRVTATQIPPVWISHGVPNAILVDQDGVETEIGIEGLGHVSLDGAAYVKLTCQSELLQEFELIDTPGISDPNIADSYRDAMVGHLDGLIWCTHAPQAWRESERRIFQSLPAALREKSILLATRSDKLVLSDRDRVLGRLQREVGREFRDIIMFSTFDAIRACEIEDGQALFAASGAEALMARLRMICAELRFQGMASGAPMGTSDTGASGAMAGSPEADGQSGVVLPMTGATVRPRRVQAVGQTPRHRRTEATPPPRPRAALKVVQAVAPLSSPQTPMPAAMAGDLAADLAADLGTGELVAMSPPSHPALLRLENPLMPGADATDLGLQYDPAAPAVEAEVFATPNPDGHDESHALADQFSMPDQDAGADLDAASADLAAEDDDFANIMAGFERLSRAAADAGPDDTDTDDEVAFEMPGDMAPETLADVFADGAVDDPDDATADMDSLADVLANISRLTAESAEAAIVVAPVAESDAPAAPHLPDATSAVHLWQAVLAERPVKSIADVIAAIGHFAEALDRAGVMAAARSAEQD